MKNESAGINGDFKCIHCRHMSPPIPVCLAWSTATTARTACTHAIWT